MTNSAETAKQYSITIRQRGGSGRGAMWQWQIHAAGNNLPAQKGVVAGTEKHAHDTAKAALAALEKRSAAK
jgi:hypothetical protein